MPRAVLDMMDRRPIWAMPTWVPAEIEAALPDSWELVVIEEETDGSGDGAARVSTRVLDAIAGAEVYFGYGVPPELVVAGPALRWIHTGAAGVGGSLSPPLVSSDIVFTNSAGIHADPIAETVLGMLLFFGRGLDLAVRNQRQATWDTEPYYVAGAPLSELSMSTVGIVGFGGIGRAVAHRVACLGAHVIALRRTESTGEGWPKGHVSGGVSPVSPIEFVRGDEGLRQLLERSDAVVLAAPETELTRGLIDARALASMKPSAVLVNVARGKILDEAALVSALEEGKIRGAGLDVFAREPLSDQSPLWGLPNVLITPHVSAVTRGFWRREADLMLHNLECCLSNAPIDSWRNVVDKQAGY